MSDQNGSGGLDAADLARAQVLANADRNHATYSEFTEKAIQKHREGLAEYPEYSRMNASGLLALRLMTLNFNTIQLSAMTAMLIDRLARLPESVTAINSDDEIKGVDLSE